MESTISSNCKVKPNILNDDDMVELVLDELVLSASVDPAESLSDDDSIELEICELMREVVGINSTQSLASIGTAVSKLVDLSEDVALESPALGHGPQQTADAQEEVAQGDSHPVREDIKEEGLDSLVQRKTFMEHMKVRKVVVSSIPRLVQGGLRYTYLQQDVSCNV